MNEFDNLNFDEYEEFLGNYEHIPDDDVWDKIRAGVPKANPIVGKVGASSGKVVGAAFWKLAAVGFFAILTSAGFLYFIVNDDNDESVAIVNDLNKQSDVLGINVDKGAFINTANNSSKEKIVAKTVNKLKNKSRILDGENNNEENEVLSILESQSKKGKGDLTNSVIADISLNNKNKNNIDEIFGEINTIHNNVNIEQESDYSNNVNDKHQTNNADPIYIEEKIIKNTNGEIAGDLFEQEQEINLLNEDQNKDLNLLDGKQGYLESILQEHKIKARKPLRERVMKNFGGFSITVYGEYGLQDWHDTDHNSERLFWDSKLHTHSNFAAGVLIGKNISKNISLQTGLEFSEINHSFKTYGNLIATEEEGIYCLKLDTYLHQYDLKATGKELVSTPASDLYMSTNHRFRFLSIPIWARYSITIGSKLDLGLSTGLAAVFLAQNRLQLMNYTTREIQLSNFEMENNSGVNDMSFSIALASDLEYSISRRTKLLVQASYKESIRANNITDNIKLKGLNFRGGLKVLLK